MFPEIREPTHRPIDVMALFPLLDEIRALASENAIELEAMEAFAAEKGIPTSHALVALNFAPDLQIRAEGVTAFAVCTGRCQLFGALPVLERFLELRAERKAAGAEPFGLTVRPCFDRCDHGAIVVSKSSHGVHPHAKVTPEQVDELVAALCEG